MSLVVEQISKKYQDKAVLADVTVSFEPQKIYGLLGRNGQGKVPCSILSIIVALLAPARSCWMANRLRKTKRN